MTTDPARASVWSMPHALPVFTIVVPTHARPRPLAACLGALARLDYPRDRYHVVVVDDASPVPPTAIVETAAVRLDVRLVTQMRAGPAAARNTGARHARGRWLAFTDDDCEPAPDWLRVLARATDVDPDAAIGGRTVNALDANPFAEASQSLVDRLYAHFEAQGAHASTRFFTTSNLCVPTARFREFGGFGAGFPLAAAEDRDLCERWQQRGLPLRYQADAVVLHRHALTFRGFSRQHFRYGRGAYHLEGARRRRGMPAPRVESLRFYWELVRPPRRSGAGLAGRAAAIGALRAWSQAVYAAGYGWERLVRRR